jgi:hypothetical protein
MPPTERETFNKKNRKTQEMEKKKNREWSFGERLRIDHQRNSTYNRCRNATCPIRMNSIYSSNAMDHGIIYCNGVLGVRVRIVFNCSITKVCPSQDSERRCY